MSSHKILLIIFLTIFTYCNGQKTSTPNGENTAKPNPTIIRKVKAVAVPPDFDTTLVSQYIRSIFQDSKGNMWFGTLGEGVVRYHSSAMLSTSVSTLTYFSNLDGFISSSVHAINEDKQGNLWFGTDAGVYKFDPANEQNESGTAFRNYNQKDGLIHLDISRKSILVDKSGTIWVGTHGGVFKYNPAADSTGGKSFSLFQQLPPINVAGIMEDKSGNIWFATSDNGVFRYDPDSYRDTFGTGSRTITHFAKPEGLGNNYAGGMAEDKAGNIWFTMKNGICKFSPSPDSYRDSLKEGGSFFTEYTSKDGLGGTEFWGIYIEQSGIIWVTARGSTTRFDPSVSLPNSEAFTVFTVDDGINCCVQSMHQDREGNMWWGAGSGLYRFNNNRFYQVKKNGPW